MAAPVLRCGAYAIDRNSSRHINIMSQVPYMSMRERYVVRLLFFGRRSVGGRISGMKSENGPVGTRSMHRFSFGTYYRYRVSAAGKNLEFPSKTAKDNMAKGPLVAMKSMRLELGQCCI